MSKQVTKSEEKQVQIVPPSQTMMEAAVASQKQEIVASDVLIPKLLLMQGISPFVMGRKAQIGDLVRNTTVEKLGDPEHPVDIVPICMVNSWMNSEIPGPGQKAQYRGTEPRNASNEHAPWDYEGPNGETMRRTKTISLYALIPSDIAKYAAELKAAVDNDEAPDLGRTVLPVLITFQSTSFKHGGKKCASFFTSVRANAEALKGQRMVAPFQYILPLTCRAEKNDKGEFYVYDAGVPRAIVKKDMTPEQKAVGRQIEKEAARWALRLSQQAYKVDDTGEVVEDAGSGPGASMEV